MPESEPKPKLIELVAPGAGQGWKAVLRNGKPAVVHEIPVPPAEAQAAVPRLQRLYEHRHPALSPVLAWGTDQQGVWVAVEPNEGTPLGSILSRGPLTPPAAAALGAAVLSGVAALHEAGIAMGGFGATAVRVTTNGEVRLAGHPAAAVRGAPSQSDLRADVRSGGMAVCAAFGVDPAGAPAPQNIPPGLVVTMRSMASGAMGPSADRAQGALREMAAPLLAPDRQTAAQVELATRAGGREMPKITPFIPAAPAPAPAPEPYRPPTREETPVRRSASYDAPDRPVQTYPAIPAVTYPPEPAPAASAPAPPVAPVEPKTSEPAVPTWSEAPPRTQPPYEVPAPAIASNPPAAAPATNPPVPAPTPAMATNPPAPAPPAPAPAAPTPPAPPTWEAATPAPAAPTPPAPPTWEPAPSAPAKPASPFESVAPAASAPSSPFATNPPAAEAPAAQMTPTPAAPPEQSKQTWSPVEAPVWEPGEAVPAEALGTGVAMAETPPAPVEIPEPAAPVRPPTAPVRRQTVPRPPSRGGIPTERPPWLIPAAVAVVIVVLLGIFGIVVLAHRGGPSGSPVAQTSPTPRTSGTPKSSPSASPTGSGQPRAVPSYGAASADPISRVVICSTATPCAIPGAADETATACDLSSCHVEVALYFTTNQKSVPYGYIIKFFDRCSGQTTDLPGPNASTPASGYIVAIATDHWTVNIPSGVKSGAIVAVAQKPAVAASAPLLLGASSCA